MAAAGASDGGGGSLPRTPKGKMPLTGTVPGYRRQTTDQPAFYKTPSPNMARQRLVVHQQQHQKAMMQLARLNKHQEKTAEDGWKALTQFKTDKTINEEAKQPAASVTYDYIRVVQP